MKLTETGIKLIKHYESLHDGDLSVIGLQPKMCPAGIWTIGWGHAVIYKGKYLKGKDDHDLALSLYPAMTVEEADQLFLIDVQVFENYVSSLKLNINELQFDALVSFAYNCGFKNLLTSTLLKRIKSRVGDIPAAFAMWNKANGETLAGLVARRNTEATLYTTGKLIFYN